MLKSENYRDVSVILEECSYKGRINLIGSYRKGNKNKGALEILAVSYGPLNSI